MWERSPGMADNRRRTAATEFQRLADGEPLAHQLGDRKVGCIGTVGGGPGTQGRPASHELRIEQLVKQPRLANSGLPHDDGNLPGTGRGRVEQRFQLGHFQFTADERGKSPDCASFPSCFGYGCKQAIEDDRLVDAFESVGTEALGFDVALHLVKRVLCDDRGAGKGELLHPCRQIDRRADRIVVKRHVETDAAHQDRAGMQSDTNPHLARGSGGNGLVHREGCVAGCQCVILTGLGCAEQRHHAIAKYARHRAAELADGFHHRFERRLEALQRLLRVSLVDQRRRADDVGKEDCQPLALRFPRLGSRRAMRRRFVGGQRNAATAAESGDRGVAEATGHAHGRQRLAACLAGASMVRVLCSAQPPFPRRVTSSKTSTWR